MIRHTPPSRRRVAGVHKRVFRVEALEDRLLLVGELGPAVTTLPATAIAETAATLNGTVNPNGNLTDALFQYSTDPNLAPHVVTTFAGSTRQSGSTDGTGIAARFFLPTGVAVDPAGNVYVADQANDTIRKITPAGVVTTLAGMAGVSGSADGTGAAARFHNPAGVAVDAAGNVYVADSTNDTIRKITPAGVVTTLAGMAGVSGSADGTGAAARFSDPFNVAVDAARNVYVTDPNNDSVREITPAGVVTTLAGMAGVSGSADGTGAAARFHNPAGLAVDAAGNVYVADALNEEIREITPAGVVTTLAGMAGVSGSADGTGAAARFHNPAALAVEAAGNVYVADALNEEIRKITPAGVVTTLAGSPTQTGGVDGTGAAARFFLPAGVAVDTAGNVYVADQPNDTIRKVSNLTVPAQTGLTGANAVPINAPLPGLQAGTTYYFRAVATDPVGTATGATLSFTTTSPQSGLTPTTTTVTDETYFGGYVGHDELFVATVREDSEANGASLADKVVFTIDGVPQPPVAITVTNGLGTAFFDTFSLTAGTHTITAAYSGGTEYAASTSKPLSVTIAPDGTTTSLTTSPNPSVAGQPVKFTADVAANPPVYPAVAVRAQAVHAHPALPAGPPPLSGKVTFKDGNEVVAVVPVGTNGKASYTFAGLTPGTHKLTATYGNDPNYSPSTSTAVTHVVTGVAAGPRVVSVLRYGFHLMPTTLVVGFNGPLDPAAAGNRANYRITDAQGTSIPVWAATYNAARATVTIYPVTQLDLHKRYTLTIVGTVPGGVTGVGGMPLDGAGVGRPGSNFVTTVDASNLLVTNPFAPGASAALRLAAWFRAFDRR